MDTINAYDEAQSKVRSAPLILNVRDARAAITEAMGTESPLRSLFALRCAVEAAGAAASSDELAQARRDRAWEVIVRVRGAYPRADDDDASTDAIIDALLAANLLR